MTSIGDALNFGTQAIRNHRVSQSPLLDASLLLCKTAGLEREQLYTRSAWPLDEETRSRYNSLINRRCAAEPVAYLIGEREFYGRSFTVNPCVLVPRPDTEVLVEQAVALLTRFSDPKVLDLCAGSGCIGITVAAEVPTADVTLADISPEALSVADTNSRNILGCRLELVTSDLFSSLSNRRFHMIMANPPYLTDTWYQQSESQVKREPRLALLGGGDDGLQIMRRILAEASAHLEPQGILIIECDYRQHETVAALMRKLGFSPVEGKEDLARLRRIVWGRLPCMKN